MRFAAAAIVLSLSIASIARADIYEQLESPKSGALEFRLTTYVPLMREPGLENFWSTYMGGSLLLVGGEYDWQFFQKYGSAALGFAASYGEQTASARLASNTGETTEEKTAFHVVPLQLLLVYRFDYAALHWRVPLVPYVKAGAACFPWWWTKGSSVEVASDGSKGSGTKWGYTLVGGISLMLDFLEPRLARDFDNDIGVNHSYIFAEFDFNEVRSFKLTGLDLSSHSWVFGLMLEI